MNSTFSRFLSSLLSSLSSEDDGGKNCCPCLSLYVEVFAHGDKLRIFQPKGFGSVLVGHGKERLSNQTLVRIELNVGFHQDLHQRLNPVVDHIRRRTLRFGMMNQ
mmetsp:Transcript_22112/g.37626  ORF Transcript_22112/g.37626 Transcript_22112/m.37626 type:complete len:105 (-) Transcript_22112:36-350(-)